MNLILETNNYIITFFARHDNSPLLHETLEQGGNQMERQYNGQREADTNTTMIGERFTPKAKD
jgi:hypothetical protein